MKLNLIKVFSAEKRLCETFGKGVCILLTSVKTAVFVPMNDLSNPTVVGVGRELVGSWQGVDREFALRELWVCAKKSFAMSGFFCIFAF